MKEKDKIQAKLQRAFNDGFIPKELKKYMDRNGHYGKVWVVEQPDAIKSEQVGTHKHSWTHDGKKRVPAPKFKERPVFRIGIGYKLLEPYVDEDGIAREREVTHSIVYDQDEIENIMREIK